MYRFGVVSTSQQYASDGSTMSSLSAHASVHRSKRARMLSNTSQLLLPPPPSSTLSSPESTSTLLPHRSTVYKSKHQNPCTCKPNTNNNKTNSHNFPHHHNQPNISPSPSIQFNLWRWTLSLILALVLSHSGRALSFPYDDTGECHTEFPV